MIRPHLLKDGRLPSSGSLGRAVAAHARTNGLSEGRVRAWVAYMMLAGRLGEAAGSGRGPDMTVKGGVALELRLHPTPRATEDIDIIVHRAQGDLLSAFDASLTDADGGIATHEGFTFQRKGQPRALENGAIRLALGVRYEGGEWTTISIDLAREELPDIAPEFVTAIDLSALHLRGPGTVPCLPLLHQIAQKIHGMSTPPRDGRRNERAKDAVDILLLEQSVEDYAALGRTCVEVFTHRQSHAWPPTPEAHEHWRGEYERLAGEYALAHPTLEEGIAAISRFVDRIERARRTAPYAPPPRSSPAAPP